MRRIRGKKCTMQPQCFQQGLLDSMGSARWWETWVLSNLSNMFNRFNALLFKLVICHVKEPFHAWPMSGQHECASLSLVLLVSKQPEQNTFPFLFPFIFFPFLYSSILVHFLIFL